MESKEASSFANRFYNKLTAHRTIRICGYGSLILYIGLVGIGVLVAAIFKPPYTIWDNWISDLGANEHTPVPILYDLACIFAGILTIPFHFYLEKYIAPIPRTADELPAPHRWSYRLMSMGFFFSMLGSFFYIGVGIFSADRDYPLTAEFGTHGLCSYGAFGGFAFSAIFVGCAVLFVRQPLIPKPFNYPIGIWGVCGPITVAILNFTGLEGVSGPLLEWSLLFAILGWIVPVLAFTLKYTEKQLHKKE